MVESVVWNPEVGLLYLSNSADLPITVMQHGLIAFKVNSSCMLEKSWNVVIGTNTGTSICYTPYTTPLVAGGLVFVGTGLSNTMYAVNAETGKIVWSAPMSGALFAAPLVINGMLLQGTFSYGVSSLYAYTLPASLIVG